MQSLMNNSDTVVITTPGSKESKFTISNSKDFFTVLTSNLYTDPFESCIRELLSNAHDAHIKANTLDIPIQVLSEEELGKCQVTITDYGTGIEPEKINDIFCVYGQSTKNKDNSQTGAFGLGCKIPFAICDSFIIKNRFNGKEYTYFMFMGNDGIPSYTQSSIVDTREHNGLTIILCNFKSDYRSCVTNRLVCILHDFLKYNELRVTYSSKINGKDIEVRVFNPINYVDDFAVFFKEEGWNSVNNVIIKYGTSIFNWGTFINYYDLNLLTLVSPIRKLFYSKDCLRSTIVINMDPNTLTITPNRENIRNTTENRKAIEDKLMEIISNIKKKAKDIINTLAKQYNNDWNQVWTNEKVLRPNYIEYLDNSRIASIDEFIKYHYNYFSLYYLVDIKYLVKKFPNIKYARYDDLAPYLESTTRGSLVELNILSNNSLNYFTGRSYNLDEYILLPNTIYVSSSSATINSNSLYKNALIIKSTQDTKKFRKLITLLKDLNINIDVLNTIKTYKDLFLEKISKYDYYTTEESDNILGAFTNTQGEVFKLLKLTKPLKIYKVTQQREESLIKKYTSLISIKEFINEKFKDKDILNKCLLIFERKILEKNLDCLSYSTSSDLIAERLLLSNTLRSKYNLKALTSDQIDFYNIYKKNKLQVSFYRFFSLVLDSINISCNLSNKEYEQLKCIATDYTNFKKNLDVEESFINS